MVYPGPMPRPPMDMPLRFCFVLMLAAACNGPCRDRSLEKCEEDPACSLISGQALDEDLMCKSRGEAVGCGDTDRICGDAITYAKDKDQVTWEFDDTCLPHGWKATESVPAVDWEICKP